MNYSDYRELITIFTVDEYNKKHKRHIRISYLEQWIICKKEIDEMLQRKGIKPPCKPKYYKSPRHIIYTNEKFIPKRNKKRGK